ncbi:MAG: hypothetical protein KJ069_21450 [Anaerolineae bacterium]|nr:hypothetical protein [Anaerolineae bacterium]
MSTHKINQIKVHFLLVLALIILFWTTFQIALSPSFNTAVSAYIPAAQTADGGHAIDVG